MNRRKLYLLIVLAALAGIALLPLNAQAAAYTWDGSSSNLWGTGANWSSSHVPNSTSLDQAVINVTTSNPVTINGGNTYSVGGNAGGSYGNYSLYIGSSAATSALSIGTSTSSTGTLDVRGNIYNAKTITINSGGNLVAYPSSGTAATYTISGGGNLALAGGTISSRDSQTNQIWEFQENVGGNGTISSAITNDAGYTLTASGGSLTYTGARAGSINNGTIAVNSDGTFYDNSSDTGALTVGGTVQMAGGTLSANTSRTYSTSNLKGYGTVSAPLTNTGNIYATGGANALKFTGAVTNTSQTMAASDGTTAGTLELDAAVTGGTVNPNNGSSLGTVNLNATASSLNGVTLGAGTVNVMTGANLATSLFTGTTTINTGADIYIQDGVTANAASGAILANSGTIHVGTGTSSTTALKNNGSASLTGATGTVILGGNAADALSGTGTWSNAGTIKGGGTISAPLTNTGLVKATNGALILSSGSFTSTGGSIGADSGGTLDANGVDITAAHVVMGGGILDSTSATLHNYSSTDLSGWGTIKRQFTNGAGGTITAKGGTLEFDATLTGSAANSLNSIATAKDAGTGVVGTFYNNTGSDLTATTISLAGGSLTSSGSHKYSSGNLSGWGTVSAPTTNTGTFQASGGSAGAPQTLVFSGAVGNASHIMNTAGANNTLELDNAITGGTINPSLGTVSLNNSLSQLIGGSVSPYLTLGAGTVNVTANASNTSLFSGTIADSATINIADGANAQANNTPVFSFTSPGTINVGSSAGATLTNADASHPLTFSGTGGQVVLNNGTIAGGAGGLSNTGQTIKGTGSITGTPTATNTGTITALGGNLTVSEAFTNTGGTMNTNGGGSDVLDLVGNITNGAINPGASGTVKLDGTTITGATLGSGAFQAGSEQHHLRREHQQRG